MSGQCWQNRTRVLLEKRDMFNLEWPVTFDDIAALREFSRLREPHEPYYTLKCLIVRLECHDGANSSGE